MNLLKKIINIIKKLLFKIKELFNKWVFLSDLSDPDQITGLSQASAEDWGIEREDKSKHGIKRNDKESIIEKMSIKEIDNEIKTFKGKMKTKPANQESNFNRPHVANVTRQGKEGYIVEINSNYTALMGDPIEYPVESEKSKRVEIIQGTHGFGAVTIIEDPDYTFKCTANHVAAEDPTTRYFPLNHMIAINMRLGHVPPMPIYNCQTEFLNVLTVNLQREHYIWKVKRIESINMTINKRTVTVGVLFSIPEVAGEARSGCLVHDGRSFFIITSSVYSDLTSRRCYYAHGMFPGNPVLGIKYTDIHPNNVINEEQK